MRFHSHPPHLSICSPLGLAPGHLVVGLDNTPVDQGMSPRLSGPVKESTWIFPFAVWRLCSRCALLFRSCSYLSNWMGISELQYIQIAIRIYSLLFAFPLSLAACARFHTKPKAHTIIATADINTQAKQHLPNNADTHLM